MTAVGGMWCDDFDADLLKVVPGAAEALGAAADIRLWTHGNETNGKLNHPSVWGSDIGMIAFFGFSPAATGKPDGYYTDRPTIECTFLEAVRDCWVHTYGIVVHHQTVWRSTWGPFEVLMYDIRGWRRALDATREDLINEVLDSLRAAAQRLIVIRDGWT